MAQKNVFEVRTYDASGERPESPLYIDAQQYQSERSVGDALRRDIWEAYETAGVSLVDYGVSTISRREFRKKTTVDPLEEFVMRAFYTQASLTRSREAFDL